LRKADWLFTLKNKKWGLGSTKRLLPDRRKKQLFCLGLLMPGFSYQKLATGIRFNVDLPELRLPLLGPLRQFHINFPPEFPFGIQMGNSNRRMGLGKQPGGNQDISDHNRMLHEIGILSFVLFF
jgi:hypothetical protein